LAGIEGTMGLRLMAGLKCLVGVDASENVPSDPYYSAHDLVKGGCRWKSGKPSRRM
jgi:hypothetical protein